MLARRKNQVEAIMKINSFVEEVMLQMETRGFDIEDAEEIPNILAEKIKENNERFEKEKPFVIFRN